MITLYDIPSKVDGPRSNYTWNTRQFLLLVLTITIILLNMKRTAYEVIYAEISVSELLYESLWLPVSSTKSNLVTLHFNLTLI